MRNRFLGLISVLFLGVSLLLPGMSQGSEIKWRWANPRFGEALQLQDVVWGDSQFVAVGRDIVVTSPHGIEWTVAKSWDRGQAQLRGVAWGDGRFVAVGDKGLILVSDDGTTWIPQTSGTTDNLDDITWTGSRYVAVGDNGTVLTSTDAVHWTKPATPTTSRLRAVAHGTAGIVVVGSSGRILFSSDGNTWQQQTSPVFDDYYDVVWDGTRFVAVSYTQFPQSSHFVTSTDGKNWVDDHTSLNSAYAIAANDTVSVAVKSR